MLSVKENKICYVGKRNNREMIIEKGNFKSHMDALKYVMNNDFLVLVNMVSDNSTKNSYAIAEIYNTKTKKTVKRKIGGSAYADRCYFNYEGEKYYLGRSNKNNKYQMV